MSAKSEKGEKSEKKADDSPQEVHRETILLIVLGALLVALIKACGL